MSPSTVCGMLRPASTSSTYCRVDGSVCSTPRAPTLETICVWKPDSIHASARTRCLSTPSRSDPLVELLAHRDVRRDEARRRHRQPQLLADQDRLRRVDLVRPRERRDGRAVRLRDRGQRVTHPHDAHDRRDDHDLVHRHRHPVAPHDRGQRTRPHHRVDAQVHQLLVAAQRGGRLLAHVAVERARVDPAPREQELQHRHVPAEVAPLQEPRAEERLAERPEREARAPVGRPDRQVMRALERVHRRRRARARRSRRSARDTARARAGRPAGRRPAG